MSLSIREAVPEDYEELSRLITDAYQEFAETLGDDWEGYRDDLADIARRAAQGSQFVAESEGRPVGTVTYYPPRKDEAAAASATFVRYSRIAASRSAGSTGMPTLKLTYSDVRSPPPPCSLTVEGTTCLLLPGPIW